MADAPSITSQAGLALDDLESALHDEIGRLGYRFDLNRRSFVKLLGGGVLVCLCIRPSLAQESGGRRRNSEDDLPKSIDAWLHIGEDGLVTTFTGKVEVGQNIRTSLSQQVAEELRVPMSSIKLVMGDTDLTPYDMGTFGSRTTPTMGPQLRQMAMSARDVLAAMAAEQLGVDKSTLNIADGRITDPKSNRSLTYSELTKGKQLTKVLDGDPPLTPPTEWKIAGTSPAKVDGRAFVTGEHQYPSDIARPGMLFGKILRPAAFKAKLVSLDTSAADRLPGVTVVRDGDFIGVTAPDTWSASQALTALQAKWDAPSQPSDTELFDYLRTHPGENDHWGNEPHQAGSLQQGYASAGKPLQQTYTVAYIAHTPMEPRAAVAEWNNGKLTVWTGTQRPFGVRDELAEAFHIPNTNVRVMMPDTGDGFGGKHTGETAIEAARLAKATGKPVKVVWTREEEFTWAYFRPGGVIDIKGAVRPDGTIVAWEFDNYNSGPSAITTPYNVANQRIQFHPADSPLRQGSYRGLAATANHFARESFMDELAHSVNIDPLKFRLKNLANDRLRAAFQAAADKFGWKSAKASPTRGFGIAGGIEKGGYITTCAEVEIIPSSRSVKIRRVVAAFDCGTVVNPDGLKNQISGAVTQGIGGALFEAIRFADGKILNPHLAQYRVPRFSDSPEIEVVLIDRKDQPSAGAGETPIVGLAPAVGNAIFQATGIRLRSLPMVPNGLPSGA